MNTVMLIEDDPEVGGLVLKTKSETVRFLVCGSFKEATETIFKHPVSLIISDFYLPDGQFPSFLEKVEGIEKLPPIAVISAFADKDMVIECLNLGVTRFLEKPFTRGDLRDLLDRFFSPATDVPRPIHLDVSTRRATVRGFSTDLTEMEFRILSFFLNHREQWISREDLVKALWPTQSVSRNTFDTHFTNLKSKLPLLKRAITSIRGRGYLLSFEKIQDN